MSRYEIVPATLEHMRVMARIMREADRAEVEGVGQVPRHLLNLLYRNSTHRHAALVDGDLAVVWGVTGAVLDDEGMAWLFSAPAIERIPISFFKEAKTWLCDIMKKKRKIWSSVAVFHHQSIRFYTMLGFKLTHPVECGPRKMMFHDLIMERA
jgi:hypothetical protein